MGSESSILKSYTLKEPPFSLPSGLAVHPAVLQDGKLASVFVYKRENEDKVNKAAKHLKTLRHPCLVRFLSCTVEADGIHLVTERVRPLEVALGTLSSAEVCAGVYDVLLALVFLHERGNLTHNNVCLSSVFVSEDGHWKLGGMETVCKMSEATPEFLGKIKPVRDQAAVPPEELAADFKTLPEAHGHARDAYSFGRLVEGLLATVSDQVSADVLSSFEHTLQCTVLSPDPQRRPGLRTLLSHDFFRNDFLEVVNFLSSLTLKSEEEKTEFFKFLLDRVSCLSEELIALRLVPLLLNQLVFAEPVAVKSFLPHLLGPKQDPLGEKQMSHLLSPAVFQARVIPVLLKLFEVHEEHVRMVLLAHIQAYADFCTQDQLKNLILPQVLLGLRDTNDSIVAITLHSLAVLVSLLGPDVVVGGERSKIFKRTAPGFSKATDFSPEGSPNHVVHSQRAQASSLPDNPPPKQEDCLPLPPTGGRIPQAPEPTVNGILGSSGNFPASSARPAEEWPDWNEPEEETVGIQMWPVGRQPWDQREPDAPPSPTRPGKEKPEPTVPPLLQESKSVKPSPPPRSDSGGGHTKSLKFPAESGLGEEFTIQVKRKPVRDPELDWFADMIPDIKPSAAVRLLPDPSSEMPVPGRADSPPTAQFSSKFAAVEVAEAEAGGWGEDGELTWEDDSSW
ncbi:protein-associating with the carboxyl-terminal domain of ezrin [Tachyglossus aculeatus]|uniref:protein-associating with the carboxyl-terminal domain of ezrin n=1 Tax=Tachyglossus aculeatus TaxID=9261 RepID=UPI0018F39956|nr:protein-associating with the carboxyl-terminal domain of ezrin [Tachyglossus aculeatus]XP_038613537.1 protein-associating with the carboxyl-terminal domain of ezrin [Tachyglossus aculeatus]XP_038613538.1 protein-associating with the carboxyl-terminal domain of ezrin [Tachyglossus aculeatus]